MNITNADNIDWQELDTKQDCKLRLKVILMFGMFTQTLSQSQKRDKCRGYANSNQETVQDISGYLEKISPEIHDDIKDDNDTLTSQCTFYFFENNESEYKRKSKAFDSLVADLCYQYSQVILNIYVPTDNPDSLSPEYFFLKFCPKCLRKSFKCKNVSLNDSFVDFCYLNQFGENKKGIDQIGYSADPTPTQVEAQISAIMSHYVYFYLDWIEFTDFYADKSRRPFDKSTIVSKAIEGKKAGLWAKLKTSLLSHPNADKVGVRVVNRIYEVLTITNDLDHDSNLIKIGQILDESIGWPVGFYRFYEILGYWEYIKQSGGWANALVNEAKNWNVCNPLFAYTKTDANSIDATKVNSDDIYMKIDNHYYTTLLYNKGIDISGYGGLLFVNDIIPPKPKYVYCTKGTDVNSFNDWVWVDVLQAFTGLSLQHLKTIAYSRNINSALRKTNRYAKLLFTGHSLGGGLASSNAIVAPGRHAITFNAASLNFIGVLLARAIRASSSLFNNENEIDYDPSKVAERVHPIRIKGEMIDVLQIVGRGLTAGLLERGYGNVPLELDTGNSFDQSNKKDNAIVSFLKTISLYSLFESIKKSFVISAAKHGINNFLYPELLSAVTILNQKVKPVKVHVTIIYRDVDGNTKLNDTKKIPITDITEKIPI